MFIRETLAAIGTGADQVPMLLIAAAIGWSATTRAPQHRPCPGPRAAAVATLTIDSLASRAADAISRGHAHVEPSFLADDALDAARVDMRSVLAQALAEREASEEFQSIQTDLLHPDFDEARARGEMPFARLLAELDELRVALVRYTGRPLLVGGGLHLMRYPVGSKFMRHADEDPALYEPIRNSISFLIYLTPDGWTADDGGALRIYEGGDESEPRQVMPTGGTLVIYDSATEHEVLATHRERDLLSGRFRETDADWQFGRLAAILTDTPVRTATSVVSAMRR